MKKIEGNLAGKGQKVGIIVARFNDFINSNLLSGAMDALTRLGVEEKDITVTYVPGAFEMPLVAKKMAPKYDSVICLGTVIRGATTHYDVVVNEVSKGVASISLETNTPILLGVLTTENIEQAIERSGTKAGNKGYEVAMSAVEMVNLMKNL